ncbi:MAG: hypothetical protein RLZZ574_2429 [Cyanobacteriota bacterium]|jgi:hypothetical protein
MTNNMTENGQIVVTNRTSGNLSILDENTGGLIQTIDLPLEEGENPPVLNRCMCPILSVLMK